MELITWCTECGDALTKDNECLSCNVEQLQADLKAMAELALNLHNEYVKALKSMAAQSGNLRFEPELKEFQVGLQKAKLLVETN